MKYDKCGYDDGGTGDFAHVCAPISTYKFVAPQVYYYLIITYPGSGTQVLMNTGDKAIGATKENKELLFVMGQKLLDGNVISSYQLVQTVTLEINKLNGQT